MTAIAPVKATAKTIKELFQSQYLIDYYQREYKWQTKQIKELIEDLTNKFKEFYKPEHEMSKISTYAPYFLGSVIISNKDGENYIIDGQQRMTSLTLLLLFLRNQQSNKSNPTLDGYIRSDNYGDVNFNINVHERNEVMEQIFQNTIENYRLKPNSSDSVVNIYDRYAEIQELFPSELYEEKALTAFIYWLIGKVQLIEIVAYSDEEAYTIFETMNDRGLSLTPVDMLKGFILANIEDESMRADAANVWKNQMLKLKSEIGDNAEHEFFRDFFRAKYASKIRSGAGSVPQDFDKMASEFHRWFRESINSLGLNDSSNFYNFVKNKIVFYVDAYIKINKYSNTYDASYANLFYVSSSEMPHFKIVILSSINDSDSEDVIRRKINTISFALETIFMKRSWAGKNTTEGGFKNSAFYILKNLREKSIEEIAAVCIKMASSSEIGNFEDKLMMNSSNKRKIYRILARITDFLEVKNDKTSLYSSLFNNSKQVYDIEHILANNEVSVESLGFSSKQAFDVERNEIGNLLILPKSFNISYGNKVYSDKIKHALYPSQNILAASLSPELYDSFGKILNHPKLSEFIRENNISLKGYESFNKDNIGKRTELYASIMKVIYSTNSILAAAELTEDEIMAHLTETDIDMSEISLAESASYVKNGMKITLKHLIDDGILLGSTEIYSTVSIYPAIAKIDSYGNIIYKEDTYDSLSSAGSAAVKEHNPLSNGMKYGWDFWAIKTTNGQMKKLSEYRDLYIKNHKLSPINGKH